MSITSIGERLRGLVARRSVPWPTVAVLAVVMTYADGFWLTSLQGAVGAVERTQRPFANWLLHSTLMLPVFVFAVARALTFARRRLGPAPGTLRTVAATSLLIVLAGTLVGIIEVVASAANDFQLQSAELQQTQSTHSHPAAGQEPGACGGTCQAESLTLEADVRGGGYASVAVLATNLVLVGWVVALRGGRLDTGPTGRRAAPGPAGAAFLTSGPETGRP